MSNRHYSHLRLKNGETVVVHDGMTIREFREEMKRRGATEYETGIIFRFLLDAPAVRKTKENLIHDHSLVLSRT